MVQGIGSEEQVADPKGVAHPLKSELLGALVAAAVDEALERTAQERASVVKRVPPRNREPNRSNGIPFPEGRL
jgi:hypothetical protein